jgi:hypothetical protein
MPLVTILLHNQQNTSKLTGKAELKLFLNEVLHSDKALFDDVRAALVEFHQEDGGSPEVPDFEITDCWYDATSKTGKVRFEYTVFFTFGCADIYPIQKSAETSGFSIDSGSSKLLLFITDQISRDPVDEF